MESAKPREGVLRIWHVPNPPHHGYRTLVHTVEEAKELLKVLGNYDRELGEVDTSNWLAGIQAVRLKVAHDASLRVKGFLMDYECYLWGRGIHRVEFNAQGLEVLLKSGEWDEWYDPENDFDICSVMRNE